MGGFLHFGVEAGWSWPTKDFHVSAATLSIKVVGVEVYVEGDGANKADFISAAHTQSGCPGLLELRGEPLAVDTEIGVVGFPKAQQAKSVSVSTGRFTATPSAPLKEPPAPFHRKQRETVD